MDKREFITVTGQKAVVTRGGRYTAFESNGTIKCIKNSKCKTALDCIIILGTLFGMRWFLNG